MLLVCFCGCRRLKGSNGLFCEAQAGWLFKRASLQKALEPGIQHLVVESDSKVIINTIVKHSAPP